MAIPDHDLLLAGFPCPAFSLAGIGLRKYLGRASGFDDEAQGTLFFEIVRILRDKRPKAFLLENVKNLVSHDRGKTFETIMDTLEKDLGYHVHWKVIDACNFVPQHRERTFIVGFGSPRAGFRFPPPPPSRRRLSEILDKDPPEKYTLSDGLWQYLQRHAEKHRALGHGFGFGLADTEGVTRTLTARYYKDGSEILLPQNGKAPRKLTPRECARLMGFGDDFVIASSDCRAYKQFGNSVVVPLVETIVSAITSALSAEHR